MGGEKDGSNNNALRKRFNYTPPPRRLRDRRFKVDPSTYNVKNLWEVHHEILRRLALGQTSTQISNALGVNKLTVSNTRNSVLGREKLEAFRQAMDAEALDIGTRIQQFAPKALKVLEDIIEGNYEEASLALRAKYASQHLGRAGFGEVKKVASISRTLTRNDIERIKERAVNGAREIGVIDAQYAEKDE